MKQLDTRAYRGRFMSFPEQSKAATTAVVLAVSIALILAFGRSTRSEGLESWEIARIAHPETVAAIAWSPDDRLLAAISINGESVSLWEWAAKKRVHYRRNAQLSVLPEGIEFSTDGTKLITTVLPPERAWASALLPQKARERELTKARHYFQSLAVFDLQQRTWKNLEGPFSGKEVIYNQCRSLVMLGSNFIGCDLTGNINTFAVFDLTSMMLAYQFPAGNIISMSYSKVTEEIVASVAQRGIVIIDPLARQVSRTVATDLIGVPASLDVSSDGQKVAIVSIRENPNVVWKTLRVEVRYLLIPGPAGRE